MKFIDELIAIYAVIQSFLFFVLAFFSAFACYLIDVSSITSLFIFPITFGVMFFYAGYGIWERKRWGYYLGIISFLAVGIAELIGIQNTLGISIGIFHLIVGSYLIYDFLFLEKI